MRLFYRALVAGAMTGLGGGAFLGAGSREAGALLFSIGMFAALGPFLSELFPTQVRTTCMGFSYNVGKSVGAMAVTGVGLLAAKYGLAQSVGAFCLGAYAIAVFALLLLPETKGVRLDDVVENEADVAPQPMLEPRT